MSQTQQTETIIERFKTLQLKVPDRGQSQLKKPITYNGSFDKFAYTELTPSIGRQYGSEVQLRDYLTADEKTLQDLAHVGKLERHHHTRGRRH